MIPKSSLALGRLLNGTLLQEMLLAQGLAELDPNQKDLLTAVAHTLRIYKALLVSINKHISMTTLHSTRPRKETTNPWIDSTKTAAIRFLVALGIHTFVAELRYIPFESMEPTLEVGDFPSGTLRDRLLVEKLNYRFYPPQRNDLVVFKAPPELDAQNLHDDLIKRVVGLPGDVVQIHDGQTVINGRVVVEPYVKEKASYNYRSVTVPQQQCFVFGRQLKP